VPLQYQRSLEIPFTNIDYDGTGTRDPRGHVLTAIRRQIRENCIGLAFVPSTY
jgi:hypothetical protein